MDVRVSSKYFKNYYVSNRIALLFKITITRRLDWKQNVWSRAIIQNSIT